eukprot:CAMPEP_0195598280 /NCGR_PEP_ID=MMETSP0815-20121206/3430_1 /TAXON_ID=97485 /ORGANISM="Prymnesium parvum, Strain Texoma1" /LENGTH=123 /DNA_ID=CAMNT_0040737669 /DNA_START=188 /DNA_END=556 /DNA_ORIENTATION=-
MLCMPTIHCHASKVFYVPEEKHLPWLRNNLQPGACEERVASLLGHLAIGHTRGNAVALEIPAARTLAVAVGPIVVAKVFIIDRIHRLLPLVLLQVGVAAHRPGERKLAPGGLCDHVGLVVVVW